MQNLEGGLFQNVECCSCCVLIQSGQAVHLQKVFRWLKIAARDGTEVPVLRGGSWQI